MAQIIMVSRQVQADVEVEVRVKREGQSPVLSASYLAALVSAWILAGKKLGTAGHGVKLKAPAWLLILF